MSGAIKRDFQLYTSPNEMFEYGYPHSNAFLQFCLKLEHCKQASHLIKCDGKNDFKLFPTVYCRKFLILSNQMQFFTNKNCSYLNLCTVKPV